MALENNATCAICGKPYRVCSTCKEITLYTPWRTIVDTIPHYKIYLILCEYTKTQNIDKAKEALSECDLSELNTFDEDIKKVIKKILEKEENIKSINSDETKEVKPENTKYTKMRK